MTKSEQLFSEAVNLMPGGVNSPVRAFRAVGSHPRFIDRARGPYVWDVDGNRYIDYIGSWGPMILGHNHPAVYEAVVKAAEKGLSFGAATGIEVQVAELVKQMVPSMEMMRMVNSGTEAVMSAVRLARGFTGRSKILKFAGCYHGHSDSMLVKAGSGAMTSGIPDSLGVPAGSAQDTLTAVYNDVSSVEALFAQYPGQIAAVILEPVACNMGTVVPKEGFLQAMRDICTREGALLIFDEVITGFRLSRGGAQERFGVTPDLSTFGKIIGGYEFQINYDESKKPSFRSDRYQFTVMMPNLNYNVPQDVPQDVPRNVPQKKESNPLEIQILNMIKKDNKISTEKMAMTLGISSKTVKRHIKDIGIIRFIGRGSNGHWEIIDD